MDEKRVRKAIAFFGRKIYELGELEEQTDGVLVHNIEYYLTAIEALEKQLPKKPICVPKPYSEELGFNDEIHCPSCSEYVGYITEGMSEPEQMEYCCDCGQRIAKDWSE